MPVRCKLQIKSSSSISWVLTQSNLAANRRLLRLNMKYLSGIHELYKTWHNDTIIYSFWVFFLCVVQFLLNINKPSGDKTLNISRIEMSVTVATEPLCGIPPGVAVWLERGDAGINGPSDGNGEECGCQPGIWVSRPCPGEEHFTLCQLGLPVQGMAWGDLSFLPLPLA